VSPAPHQKAESIDGNSLQYELRIDYNNVKTVRQYGQLIIAFNLPTQWHSRKREQVWTRASGRIKTFVFLCCIRIKTLNSAI